MQATTEGRPGTSLRSAIAWIFLVLGCVVALSFYKGAALDRFVRESDAILQSCHKDFLNNFQANFYFFYEEQFVPGVDRVLGRTPYLERVQILSAAGTLLFDSADRPKNAPAAAGKTDERANVFSSRRVVDALALSGPSVFVSGFRVQVLIPAGQYGILYTLFDPNVRNRVVLAFLACLALIPVVLWSWRRFFGPLFISPGPSGSSGRRRSGMSVRRFSGLRFKFMFTIVLINMITGGIVYFTLSALQTREQTERIRKESILFAQFSTAEVVSDFSNYFYFYYADKFLPAVKTIIATNENLISFRIISRRTSSVLFDSELAGTGPVPEQVADLPKADIAADVETELKARDVVIRHVNRGGEKLLSIVNTYRNDNQETLFYVEYFFSFQSLERAVQAIRRQILLDLIPALAIGLVIAILFGQLLISPVRRLLAAVQRVSSGDFDVVVDSGRGDEIGELVSAFNAMTGELRKKKELRKYLSDSTYQKIMEAPDLPDGARIGGTRVAATVLFCDIRNFVAHCESLEAEEVTSMLNEYFSAMVEVVYKHGGEVDKFIGDALLAVFYASDKTGALRSPGDTGAPEPAATALQSLYCALEMRERLKEFNAKRESLGKNVLEIGIGITHGEIISGPIGSKDRMDFTVIGDVVNVASRIEKLSKNGQHTKIVFSNQVEEKVRDLVDSERLSHEPIKGKEEEILVYELVRIRDLGKLVGQLSAGDLTLKLRSLDVLGQSRNPAAIPAIVAALGDPSEPVRLQAVLALGKLCEPGQNAGLDPLLDRLRAETADRVISALIATLGKLSTDDRILEVARFLDSPDERIVANTVEALGQVRTPRCMDLILPKLASRNNRVKANAAMALFAAGHVEVIDTLKPMLMHSDPLMRSSAAFAIGELTSLAQKDKLFESWRTKTSGIKVFLAELQETVPMLVSLLKDGEPIVKRQAVIALGKIKDKSAVLPIIDNIDFEKDSKELLRDVANALRAIGSHKLVRDVVSRLT